VLPWPEWWTPSLAWEDLSAVDRRALIEMLVDKIVIERRLSKIDKDGRRYDTIRTIPYEDPSKRLSGSGRCTKLGSRSFPGSDQRSASQSLIGSLIRFDYLNGQRLRTLFLTLTWSDRCSSHTRAQCPEFADQVPHSAHEFPVLPIMSLRVLPIIPIVQTQMAFPRFGHAQIVRSGRIWPGRNDTATSARWSDL
jgi:hypothetical protein